MTIKRDEDEFRLCKQELEEHLEACTKGEIDLFFMIWSFATTLTVGGIVVAMIKLL